MRQEIASRSGNEGVSLLFNTFEFLVVKTTTTSGG